eukprot:9733767-Alexandrium_andersonii.AAC.1
MGALSCDYPYYPAQSFSDICRVTLGAARNKPPTAHRCTTLHYSEIFCATLHYSAQRTFLQIPAPRGLPRPHKHPCSRRARHHPPEQETAGTCTTCAE